MPKSGRTITLSPTGRERFPNGMTTDVARVLRAHGYRVDALALLDALRELTRVDESRAEAA